MGNVSDIDVCRVRGKRSGEVRLQIDGISTFYGEAQALKDVSLRGALQRGGSHPR